MLADIPSLFDADGKIVVEWPKDTRFFMQWYGLPAKLIGGVVHRWNEKWVPCDEKNDFEYIDARNCSASTTFIANEEKLEDGLYFLVGLTTDNPYGFRHPMLIPFDFYEVLYDKPVEYEHIRNFLMFQPNMFGILLNSGDKWAHSDCNSVGLKFNYEDGKVRDPIVIGQKN